MYSALLENFGLKYIHPGRFLTHTSSTNFHWNQPGDFHNLILCIKRAVSGCSGNPFKCLDPLSVLLTKAADVRSSMDSKWHVVFTRPAIVHGSFEALIRRFVSKYSCMGKSKQPSSVKIGLKLWMFSNWSRV